MICLYLTEERQDTIAQRPPWAFMTSHGFVLLAVERQPNATMREIAETVGITQRQVHRIVDELEAAGYISRKLVGRNNHYAVYRSLPMRHSAVRANEIGDLLDVLSGQERRR